MRTIKRTHLSILFTSMFLAISMLSGDVAFGQTVSLYGRVTFVGTMPEHVENGYHAQFRFRLADSTCENGTQKAERWVHVRSGRMDGEYAHNMANVRNAYNTLMTAFLTGKSVQVDGVANCSTSSAQTINLWSSGIGIMP